MVNREEEWLKYCWRIGISCLYAVRPQLGCLIMYRLRVENGKTASFQICINETACTPDLRLFLFFSFLY